MFSERAATWLRHPAQSYGWCKVSVMRDDGISSWYHMHPPRLNKMVIKTTLKRRRGCEADRSDLALVGVHVGFEREDFGVAPGGSAVQVQAGQELHVPDPSSVHLHQVLHPARLLL